MADQFKRAEKAQRDANDELDAIRRAQRETSQQTAADVLRSVLERAKQKVWVKRPNSK